MLPKRRRLASRGDIVRVAHSKNRVRSGPFSLFCALSTDLEGSRYAIVVPTSVSKRATARNRIRRRISEIIRALEAATKHKKTHDCIIRAYPGAEKLSFFEITEHIEELLARSV